MNFAKVIEISKIARHSYSDFMVKLAVELYLVSNCGFAKISALIEYLDKLFSLGFEKIPCANTIENWVKKSGYHIYQQTPKTFSDKNYAEIIDESIMLGSEKMLLVLGVEAEKTTDTALQHKEVKVLDISVAQKWNSETVSAVLTETSEKVGHAPEYVISDNDAKLTKSFRAKCYSHIRDIGHTMALLIEQVYGKDKEFKSYTDELSKVKSKEVMRPCSYLLPPRQRTIARFMNLFPVLEWSKKIYDNFSRFSREEAQTFKFVIDHFPLIEELHQIFACVNSILEDAKNHGFTKKNIDRYLKEIETRLTHHGARVGQVKISLMNYLKEEKEKLPSTQNRWHCSSDIIESLFGFYKSRKSRNSLNGITSYALVLPLITAVGHSPEPSGIDFKEKLEGVFMKDLSLWKENKLTENITVKRRNKLAA